MKYFFIGLLIGIGKIIPGVSGSIIAIRFNIYERIINSLKYYFHNIKDNSVFLSSIFSGVIIAILLLSKVVLYVYTCYELITKILFAILILSGLKDILKKDNNYFITFLTFIFSLLLIKLPFKYSINYFVIGIIEAFSMIIPGISGTAIFVSLGVYEKVLKLFINFYLPSLFFFGLGFSLTIILCINIISYLFKKYKKETYSSIVGFLLSSIVLMFI